MGEDKEVHQDREWELGFGVVLVILALGWAVYTTVQKVYTGKAKVEAAKICQAEDLTPAERIECIKVAKK